MRNGCLALCQFRIPQDVVCTQPNLFNTHQVTNLLVFKTKQKILLFFFLHQMWNYEALVKVLLYSARHAESEGFVQRIGIYLLNSLACQVEGTKKRLLGKLGCVGTMLILVHDRVECDLPDDVLEVAWSTMWNMTDETPINCQRFLDERGMSLFLRCVEVGVTFFKHLFLCIFIFYSMKIN